MSSAPAITSRPLAPQAQPTRYTSPTHNCRCVCGRVLSPLQETEAQYQARVKREKAAILRVQEWTARHQEMIQTELLLRDLREERQRQEQEDAAREQSRSTSFNNFRETIDSVTRRETQSQERQERRQLLQQREAETNIALSRYRYQALQEMYYRVNNIVDGTAAIRHTSRTSENNEPGAARTLPLMRRTIHLFDLSQDTVVGQPLSLNTSSIYSSTRPALPISSSMDQQPQSPSSLRAQQNQQQRQLQQQQWNRSGLSRGRGSGQPQQVPRSPLTPRSSESNSESNMSPSTSARTTPRQFHTLRRERDLNSVSPTQLQSRLATEAALAVVAAATPASVSAPPAAAMPTGHALAPIILDDSESDTSVPEPSTSGPPPPVKPTMPSTLGDSSASTSAADPPVAQVRSSPGDPPSDSSDSSDSSDEDSNDITMDEPLPEQPQGMNMGENQSPQDPHGPPALMDGSSAPVPVSSSNTSSSLPVNETAVVDEEMDAAEEVAQDDGAGEPAAAASGDDEDEETFVTASECSCDESTSETDTDTDAESSSLSLPSGSTLSPPPSSSSPGTSSSSALSPAPSTDSSSSSSGSSPSSGVSESSQYDGDKRKHSQTDDASESESGSRNGSASGSEGGSEYEANIDKDGQPRSNKRHKLDTGEGGRSAESASPSPRPTPRPRTPSPPARAVNRRGLLGTIRGSGHRCFRWFGLGRRRSPTPPRRERTRIPSPASVASTKSDESEVEQDQNMTASPSSSPLPSDPPISRQEEEEEKKRESTSGDLTVEEDTAPADNQTAETAGPRRSTRTPVRRSSRIATALARERVQTNDLKMNRNKNKVIKASTKNKKSIK
ncbi:hypothetical protein BGX33_009986 [Mortierella sp. NVP41]|nr:hypothetical protein BGX33_009986 [Mortierella sp. NVP41]